MSHGELHRAGADGRCEACGEPFPCSNAEAVIETARVDIKRAEQGQPAPTERELHQLAARAAALQEIAVIYRAVYAQRGSYAVDSETYRALSYLSDNPLPRRIREFEISACARLSDRLLD